MNLLLLHDSDFRSSRTARIRDRRVDHIRQVLQLREGDNLRVGRLGGRIGTARIAEIRPGRLDIEVVELETEPPPRLPIELVLAVPRPKFLGRILQTVACFGVEKLTLLHSARVEESYWQSSVLEPESIDRHFLLGLEQGCDTHPPAIELRRSFRDFVTRELPDRLADRPGLLAAPSSSVPFPRQVALPHLLIVGPEGGFLEQEVAALREAGATTGSLGERTLRVEVAVTACLSRCLPDPRT